jgi:signal transduction histidine kinase
VTDSGHGIDAATARILFTPFARGANPYNSGAGGYGIGLAASKQLAELHAATLTLVTNADARGSVAELRLPATRAISEPAAAISA